MDVMCDLKKKAGWGSQSEMPMHLGATAKMKHTAGHPDQSASEAAGIGASAYQYWCSPRGVLNEYVA